jgi:hypothetical protein
MTADFASMPGAQVLRYIRDAVMSAATSKRTFLEQSAAVGGAPITRQELGDVQALHAAAEVIEFAIGAGQEAATRGKDPPDWVLRMAAQARVALTASEEKEDIV